MIYALSKYVQPFLLSSLEQSKHFKYNIRGANEINTKIIKVISGVNFRGNYFFQPAILFSEGRNELKVRDLTINTKETYKNRKIKYLQRPGSVAVTPVV